MKNIDIGDNKILCISSELGDKSDIFSFADKDTVIKKFIGEYYVHTNDEHVATLLMVIGAHYMNLKEATLYYHLTEGSSKELITTYMKKHWPLEYHAFMITKQDEVTIDLGAIIPKMFTEGFNKTTSRQNLPYDSETEVGLHRFDMIINEIEHQLTVALIRSKTHREITLSYEISNDLIGFILENVPMTKQYIEYAQAQVTSKGHSSLTKILVDCLTENKWIGELV